MIVRCGEVRMDYLNRSFLFDATGLTEQIEPGDLVVVETDFGMDIGQLMRDICEQEVENEALPLMKLLRKVNEDDAAKLAGADEKETRAIEVSGEEIEKAKLGMKLVSARYTFDGTKVTLCYTAEGRVDFRELVKTLASRLRTRIELRQVGVRDEARLHGGIGPCGRPLCCATFLREFQSVSIKMAKEQGLPLNPTKISGICGRLFCCLKYEHDTYMEIKKKMPRMGEEVNIEGVKGRVVGLSIPKNSVEIETLEGGRSWAALPPLEFENRFQPCERKCGCGSPGTSAADDENAALKDEPTDDTEPETASDDKPAPVPASEIQDGKER
jgi:cell fate regulator YaaT (PSP1 superfamily)